MSFTLANRYQSNSGHLGMMGPDLGGAQQSIAHVGGNDTAGNFSISFNAKPNYKMIQMKDRRVDPYFPHLRKDDVRHMDAHKGLLAYTIVPSHGNIGNAGYGWSVSYDTVQYLDNVNGMLDKKSTASERANFAASIRVFGLVEEDIMAEPHREAGNSMSNNIISSGKQTMPNTGPYTIKAGQNVMWELPEVKDDRVTNSGTDLIPAFEDNLAPLITVPYIPQYHKGSPQMLYSALTDIPSSHVNVTDQESVKTDAVKLLNALKIVALIGMKALGTEINADTLKKMNIGSSEDSFSKIFTEMIFNPTKNFMFTGDGSTPTAAHANVANFASGIFGSNEVNQRTFPGGAQTKRNSNIYLQFNVLQIAAFATLYQGIASVENLFSGRIIGRAYTTAAKGRDFDILLSMSGGGSL